MINCILKFIRFKTRSVKPEKDRKPISIKLKIEFMFHYLVFMKEDLVIQRKELFFYDPR